MNKFCFFFFQAEDGIRDRNVTGVQTCALPISSKLLRAVSVRTNVPAVNPTPRTTAMAVSSSRSFRASRLLRAACNTRSSALHRLQVLEHALGCRCQHLVEHAAVGQEHDAVRV